MIVEIIRRITVTHHFRSLCSRQMGSSSGNIVVSGVLAGLAMVHSPALDCEVKPNSSGTAG